MTDVMLDLETLSVEPNAAVISIGAIIFDPDTTALGEPFFRAIRLESVEEHQVNKFSRHVSPVTVAWWMNQEAVAQRASFANADAVNTNEALLAFVQFLQRNDVSKVWGNGASFDNVILSGLYKAAGSPIPWHFTMDRCYRTMKNLGYGPALKREGTFHNPLDDARTQAIHLQQIMYAIRNKERSVRGNS